MFQELVSIIMPSYNTGDYIKSSIDSVISQTYTNWELIIVDDCSTDETESVVTSIQDPRIKFLKNEKNSGAAYSRNRALREAKGRWMAFLDSDDLWYPEKLEKQVSFMEKNGYGFSYTYYEEIDVNGNKNGTVVKGPRKITKCGMFNYCWPGCLTVMYDSKKTGLIQINEIQKNNDYAIWLKVSKFADCYLYGEILGKYRRGRQGSISTQSIKKLIKWHYKLFREAENQPVLEATFNTLRNMFFGFCKKMFYVKNTEKN